MSQNTQTFEIAGTRYHYTRMSPEKMLDGLTLVSPALKGDVSKLFGNSKAILYLFAEHLEVEHKDPGTGKSHKLSLDASLIETKYTSKPGELIALIAKCFTMEYGDFLPGQPGADAVMEVAGPFMSLIE